MSTPVSDAAGRSDPGFVVAPPALVSLAVVGTQARFPVRRIYCVGRNYLEHIREMKEGDERDPPFFFQKPRDAIVETGGPVPYPPDTADFQHEIELVVAIGRQGRAIGVQQAADHIFGYAVGIDLTRRDRQVAARAKMLPWEPGKSFDHSAPCGPIHSVEQVGHFARGALAITVNGAPRQTGDLAQMIWNVSEIVAQLSLSYRLMPGDLIFTGTPAGVGPVGPGDTLVGTVEGLAPLTVIIGDAEA